MRKVHKIIHYKKETMNKRIIVRCSESTLLLLKKTAKKQRMSISNYVRTLVEKSDKMDTIKKD